MIPIITFYVLAAAFAAGVLLLSTYVSRTKRFGTTGFATTEFVALVAIVLGGDSLALWMIREDSTGSALGVPLAEALIWAGHSVLIAYILGRSIVKAFGNKTPLP